MRQTAPRAYRRLGRLFMWLAAAAAAGGLLAWSIGALRDARARDDGGRIWISERPHHIPAARRGPHR